MNHHDEENQANRGDGQLYDRSGQSCGSEAIRRDTPRSPIRPQPQTASTTPAPAGGTNLDDPNIIMLLRVSTDAQDVARQRTDRQKLITRFGVRIERTLELFGVSGTATLEDSQVQQILKDLKRADISGIGVSSLDRLFRPGKRYGQFSILDRFVDEGKKIWSTREGLIDPATDEGYDKCITAGGRAGAEWREIKRRMLDGRKEKIAVGILDHGNAPDGYEYIHKWKEGGNSFKIDLDRAPVIRQIYSWRRTGTPCYSIVKMLHAAGIKSARGGLWSRQVVQQILQNRSYIGEHIRFGIIVPVPAIIDRDLWEAVQTVNEHSRAQHIGRPAAKHQYLLQGYLWCKRCGRRCLTNPNHGHPFYRCGNIEYKPFRRLCPAPAASKKTIEATAWPALWALLKNPQLLLQMGRAYYDSLDEPQTGTQALTAELAHLQQRIENTQYMVREGLYDRQKGKTEIQADQFRIAQIRQELASVGRVVSLPSEHAIEATCREITEGPEPETYQERREILESLVDLDMRFDDGNLTITGKVPVANENLANGLNGLHTRKCKRNIDAACNFVLIPFTLNLRIA